MASKPIEPDAWDDPNYAGWSRAIPRADLQTWDGKAAPQRAWALDKWIPLNQCTYLTGPGAAGKSLLAQQLCTCVALGIPFLGMQVRQSRALYLSCEDDFDELHRREEAICRRLGVRMSDLAGKLELSSGAGSIGNELATFSEKITQDEFGSTQTLIRPTSTFHALRGLAQAEKWGFVSLDNVAHLFAGNENVRIEVASFMALMNQLAQAMAGAVLLIGHPNKGRDAYSGSTAWENQVRSRLFMDRVEKGEDDDVRFLRREKANYASNGGDLTFRWLDWAFVRDDDLPPSTVADIAATASATAHNARFLACLAEMTRQQRHVSEKASPNYAPKVFERMSEAKGSTKRNLADAMDRLFRLGQIERAELWRGPDRKPVFGLRETQKAG